MSVWLAYDRVTPAMLHRGEYGARVGVPRILRLLDSHEIKATFFVPGHTVESFPAEVESILAAGHEIAHHSYAHIDPSGQTREEERGDMERAWRVLEGIGVMPFGFRSPSADLSPATLELIEEMGFLYDSSLMTDDYVPFHPRIGDRVARGVPLERGREARFWELPMCFELDDWVHFQFNFDPYRKGGAPPSARARDLAGRVRLHARERRRRRAHLLHAPAGDRPRAPDRDARRADRPLPRRRRALRAHGRRRARLV